MGHNCFNRIIIDICNTPEELNKFEEYYIKKYKACEPNNDYYNISAGGKSGNTFAGKTPEEIYEIGKKISDANSKENHWCYGKHFSSEHKDKISKSHIGKKLSKSHIENMRLAHIGIRCGKDHPNWGKTGKDIPSSKSVICTTTLEVFECISDVKRKYNIDVGSIVNCCKGKRKSAGKHPETGEKMVWMYYEEWLQLNKDI